MYRYCLAGHIKVNLGDDFEVGRDLEIILAVGEELPKDPADKSPRTWKLIVCKVEDAKQGIGRHTEDHVDNKTWRKDIA